MTHVVLGTIVIALATGIGAWLLFAHAVRSSREEQARHDELEERAREAGRRRRAAEAEAARVEAERKAQAAARKPPPPASG